MGLVTDSIYISALQISLTKKTTNDHVSCKRRGKKSGLFCNYKTIVFINKTVYLFGTVATDMKKMK